MSTYLVAIVVSDFKYTSREVNGIEYRVFARPDAINQTKYALSTMDIFVQFFEEKFKQEYQIPKLDMVALPDFPSGAMENWGLLTYKETNLLYDEDHSSLVNKRTIRNVIAHEIAHQWFGNLVSPLWWKYLWLNEGFARYFQYHAPEEVRNRNSRRRKTSICIYAREKFSLICRVSFDRGEDQRDFFTSDNPIQDY